MQHGFKVIEVPEILPASDKRYQWRRCYPFDFAIESHPNCPIDGTAFETIAALVSLTLPEKIRIGCCPRCGLVGYIDRPSQADIDRYYAETWMGQQLDDEVQQMAEAINAGLDDTKRETEVFKSLPVDRSLPVLEIGCGYGRIVHALKQAGFTNIDATEHCQARAEAVRRVFGVNVTTEMPQKRYGLIVSHHVLEHCTDPAALIRACAERQENGDWMSHCVPRFGGEPSMGVLLFLPHLWSFSSLGPLFEECCYQEQCTRSYGSLHSIAQKGFNTPEKRPDDMVTMAIWKLASGLGLVPQQSILAWNSGRDGVSWSSASGTYTRHIVAERLTGGFITDAPIELQFEGRVMAFVK